MNIIFLCPIPEIGRFNLYLKAAESLKCRFGHKVIFVYAGPKVFAKSDIPIIHFDSWVKMHEGKIVNTDIIELERKFLNSNLWLPIVAERRVTDYSYLGMAYLYQRFSKKELEFFTKAVTLFYLDTIEKYCIELAIANAPDNIHSAMLYEISRSSPLRCLGLQTDVYWDQSSHFFYDDCYYCSSRLKSLHERYLNNFSVYVEPLLTDIEEFIESRIRNIPTKTFKSYQKRHSISIIGRWLRLGINKWREFTLIKRGVIESYYKQHNILANMRGFLFQSINTLSRDIFIERNKTLSEPFIFFPIHLQPEATLLCSAQVFCNQLAVIQAISASLPAGYTLAVKDHPYAKGQRSFAFYKGIQSLPNVTLLPTTFPSGEILDRSSLVITIKGTAGFEALLRNKTVITLAPVWYDLAKGVVKLKGFRDMPYVLKRELFREITEEEKSLRARSLYALIAAYKSSIYRNEQYENTQDEAIRSQGLAEIWNDFINKELCEQWNN